MNSINNSIQAILSLKLKTEIVNKIMNFTYCKVRAEVDDVILGNLSIFVSNNLTTILNKLI